MKIITLTDKKVFDCHLKAEHGLSVYIEVDDCKILFDTGQSDVFLQNAEAIGLDIREIDVVVISHGHYDHIGGLISFLNVNDKAQVYLKKEVFDGQYYSVRKNIRKDIGYSLDLMKYRNRFVFLEEKLTRLDNLLFICKIEKKFSIPKGNQLLFKSKEDQIVADDFQHELVFGIDTPEGLCIFCGCAHNGILNMIHSVQKFYTERNIKLIFGGFHLVDENEFVSTETEDELKEIAHELNVLVPWAEFYTGHCTGEKAVKEIGKILNNRFHLFYSGQVIQI